VSTIHRAPHLAQLPPAAHSQAADATLTREERRNVALAALEIMKRRHQLKIAQIEAEKRALLAQG
jgi:hypothetical protein